jgi:hypothetical protein
MSDAKGPKKDSEKKTLPSTGVMRVVDEGGKQEIFMQTIANGTEQATSIVHCQCTPPLGSVVICTGVRFALINFVQQPGRQETAHMPRVVMQDCVECHTVFAKPVSAENASKHIERSRIINAFVQQSVTNDKRRESLSAMNTAMKADDCKAVFVAQKGRYKDSYNGAVVDVLVTGVRPALIVYGRNVDSKKLLPVGPCELYLVAYSDLWL